MKLFKIIFGISSLAVLSLAYPMYKDKIPNGSNIPHPCKINYRWPGVGHENPLGGGARNPFGLDFAKQGHVYTKALCLADSDGDGRTNGEELGDPSCTWTPGSIPEKTDNLSHPGVCDPYNSTLCQGKNAFLSCELSKFEICDSIKKPEVKSLDFRFPVTKLPPKETNYLCVSFDLPDDQDYHVIAVEPILDNQNVVHHMLLFGCNSHDDAPSHTPESCGMGNIGNCSSSIGGWTVGSPGGCFGNSTGFRIGKSSFKSVRLQIHYNNPTLSSNFTDSSGLRIYYQPARPDIQDLTIFIVGQMVLEIPPGKSDVQEVGVCPSSCTRNIISKPAYVVSTVNHMHYLGKSEKVEVYRNGTWIKDLTNDVAYSYDSPIAHIHDPPFVLLPGDELRTICNFNSLSSRRYVYFGEGTFDEMCYGFLTLYPPDALKQTMCISYGSLSMCDIFSGNPLGQCDWVTFINPIKNAKIFNDVTRSCNLDGFCRPECMEVLKGLENHPCLNGEANKWITNRLETSIEGLQFLGRLRSCSMRSCTTSTSDTSTQAAPAV